MQRKYHDLPPSEKIKVYSKALFWIPVGMGISVFWAYIYLTQKRSGFGFGDPALTEEEAAGIFHADPIAVLLFALVASLSANITTVKIVISSKSVRFRGWG
ncbi:MAG: hypothetical protein PF495_12860, partial [Spirochaetales bacterium]|nr:hypothetical protein [Spirochaetales bacterium]